MGKLTATMVVDISDRTGNKTQAIIGNLDRLKRAERDRMLAERGMSLNRVQRLQEREMIERARSAQAEQTAREAALAAATQKRSAAVAAFAVRGAAAVGVAAYAAGRAYSNYADIEDRVAGIAINADKGVAAIQPTMQSLRTVAQDTKQSFDTVMTGLDTLVASGRSLDESMSFLPSVALTAKASRAEIADIALTADAVGGSFNIAGDKMQQAFDMLVTGGKLGKFELKDMAQYLPSLAPSFAALGYKGTEGLGKLVAMLQTVRMQAGSSGEAATYLSNVLNKMYSEDVAKRFDKFGVDLPKALDKARREGKDVLEVFLDMTQLALKGDLTKITKLFGDAEMQKGVRALVMLRDAQANFNAEINKAKGSALADFNAQADLSKNKIQQLSNNWDTFMAHVGSGVATVVNPALDKVNQAISDDAAVESVMSGMDAEQRGWLRDDFYGRFSKANPQASYEEMVAAFRAALIKVGRGGAKTIFDDIDTAEGRRRGGETMSKYPSRGSYDPAAHATGIDKQPLGQTTGVIPVPTGRPGSEPAEVRLDRVLQNAEDVQRRYPSRGAYDPEQVRRERLAVAVQEQRSFNVFGAFEDRLAGRTPQNATAPTSGRQPVVIEGTPSVTLSGTPSVTITNPPPRPNITVHMPVTIQEAPNAEAVARQLGQAIRSEMDGLQTSTNDSGL